LYATATVAEFVVAPKTKILAAEAQRKRREMKIEVKNLGWCYRNPSCNGRNVYDTTTEAFSGKCMPTLDPVSLFRALPFSARFSPRLCGEN
jgi:hypothetical protein